MTQTEPIASALSGVVGDALRHGVGGDWLRIPGLVTVDLVRDGLAEGLEGHVEGAIGELVGFLLNYRNNQIILTVDTELSMVGTASWLGHQREAA